MRRLRRCHKSGKVCYPSKDDAEAKAAYIVEFEKREAALRAYRCECGAWHLTKIVPPGVPAVRPRVAA